MVCRLSEMDAMCSISQAAWARLGWWFQQRGATQGPGPWSLPIQPCVAATGFGIRNQACQIESGTGLGGRLGLAAALGQLDSIASAPAQCRPRSGRRPRRWRRQGLQQCAAITSLCPRVLQCCGLCPAWQQGSRLLATLAGECASLERRAACPGLYHTCLLPHCAAEFIAHFAANCAWHNTVQVPSYQLYSKKQSSQHAMVLLWAPGKAQFQATVSDVSENSRGGREGCKRGARGVDACGWKHDGLAQACESGAMACGFAASVRPAGGYACFGRPWSAGMCRQERTNEISAVPKQVDACTGVGGGSSKVGAGSTA